MIEEWRDIEGYEGLYQVSNLGNVRSLYDARLNRKRIKLLKGVKRNGYLIVGLHKGSNVWQVLIHRLVACAFIQNPNNKPQVNHINGVKTDNRADNLEWATAKENTQHALKTGLSRPAEHKKPSRNWFTEKHRKRMAERVTGENNPMAKLSEDDVVRIREMFADGLSLKKIYTTLGIPRQTVTEIVKGQRWASVKDGNVCDKNMQKRKVKRIKGNEIVIYNSITEAAAQLEGADGHSAISACCRGKRKTYKGYIWQYV